LTHKLAVDKEVIDCIRPMISNGYKPQQLRAFFLELHTKEHARQEQKRERRLDRQGGANLGKTASQIESDAELFSDFDDPQKYDGYVPSSKYLGSVSMVHYPRESSLCHAKCFVAQPLSSIRYRFSKNIMHLSRTISTMRPKSEAPKF
jgi:hypothetical protein